MNVSNGSRKRADLNNRLIIAEQTPNSVFINIHMNVFASPRYRVLHVFYSPNHPGGKSLAETVKVANKTYLVAENERSIIRAGSYIYLLHYISKLAAVLCCEI